MPVVNFSRFRSRWHEYSFLRVQIASLLLFRFIIYILWSWRPWDCEWSMHHDARKRLQAVRALWEPRKWSKKSGIRIAWDGTRGTNEWIDGHGHYVVTRVLKWSTLNILIVLYPASWSHLCFHETVSYSRHAFSIITWEDHLGIPPSWLIRTIKRIVNYRIYLCSPLSLSLFRILDSIIHRRDYSHISILQ